jgi:hypothetical protein
MARNLSFWEELYFEEIQIESVTRFMTFEPEKSSSDFGFT